MVTSIFSFSKNVLKAFLFRVIKRVKFLFHRESTWTNYIPGHPYTSNLMAILLCQAWGHILTYLAMKGSSIYCFLDTLLSQLPSNTCSANAEKSVLFALSLLMMIKEAFVDRVNQDQTAQNVLSDLRSTLSTSPF